MSSAAPSVARRVLTVERAAPGNAAETAAQARAEAIEAQELPPLPADHGAALAAPIEDEELLPDVVEPAPVAPQVPLPEPPPMQEELEQEEDGADVQL